MIASLLSRSLILSSLLQSKPRSYQSQLVNTFIAVGNKLILYITSSKRLQPGFFSFIISSRSLKPALLFLFIIFLPLVTKSNIQLASFSSLDVNSTSISSEKRFGIPIFSPSNILLLCLGVILLMQYLRSELKLKIWDFEVILFYFLVIILISSIGGINTQASFVWLLRMLFSFVIYLVFSRLMLGKKEIRVILYAILTTIVVNSLVALLQLTTGGLIGLLFENIRSITPPETLYFQGLEYFRVVGLLSHPNILSGYLALLAPITLIGWFNKNIYIRIVSKLATFACIILPIFALSRWGLITATFAITTTLAIFIKTRQISFGELLKMARIGAIVLIILFAVIFSNQNIVKRFSSVSPEDRSLSARLELLSQSMFMIKENPLFGIGGGNFPVYLINYDFTESHVAQRLPGSVHSFYPLLTTEIGLAGLLVLFTFIVSFVKFYFMKFRYLKGERRLIATSLLVVYSTFFFHGIWEVGSLNERQGFIFWLFLGLLVNILSQKRREKIYQ